ncbi:peptidoglycan DD-metalloendopeptidase family protein [Algoriphagus sp. CAU 1675]|uniref:peptidoglycan DD-metalloendopeptidase family protein n=1 Tax=Algoriphagus sp. CAU 1675 TaxID=3032597 RepID=UPI0023DC06B2|nr:peptidoglycan DD-metalloendopeptidase family protein [Algoriphagus sp. CAU 1675]MDF2156627.1 peptidoglycan DD-metalloendopeptidase family protein [Algoriphagus sp. CAU 1675]
MDWLDLDVFPIMGKKLDKNNTLELDFSPSNKALESVDLGNTQVFDCFVFEQLANAGKEFGIGGYLEKRAIYSRSAVFATAEEDFRNIHLGVDIWTKAGSPVYVPLDGKIHSFQDNLGFGNYGPTIILEHEVKGQKLFSLYGHLQKSDLVSLHVGKELKAGEVFCHVGPFPENGDWPPHLHFQLMLDMNGNFGDFPGVASERDLEKFKALCPDPNVFLKFDSTVS